MKKRGKFLGIERDHFSGSPVIGQIELQQSRHPGIVIDFAAAVERHGALFAGQQTPLRKYVRPIPHVCARPYKRIVFEFIIRLRRILIKTRYHAALPEVRAKSFLGADVQRAYYRIEKGLGNFALKRAHGLALSRAWHHHMYFAGLLVFNGARSFF